MQHLDLDRLAMTARKSLVGGTRKGEERKKERKKERKSLDVSVKLLSRKEVSKEVERLTPGKEGRKYVFACARKEEKKNESISR